MPPKPRPAPVTIGEIDGALLHVERQEDGQVMWTEERKLLEYHRGRGVFYPLIQVRKPAPAAATTSLRDPPSDELVGCTTSSGSTFPAMVAVVGGVLLVVFELSASLSPDAWLRALVSCAVLLLSLLSAHRMRDPGKGQKFAIGGLAAWFGSDCASPADSRASTQREDLQPVRAFAWHPHLNMFAVALADANTGASEYVAFYDLDAEQWLHTIVKHQFQSTISCLEFQPNGGSTIAVACQEGIGIWQLEPAHHAPLPTDQTQPLDSCLSAWMSWLQLSGYRGACCISWSPCGRFLVAGYSSSNSPVVWDVCSQRPTPLQSLVPFFFFDSFGGGLERVQWSPAGTHVLVSSRSGLLAIYETRSWSFSLHRAGAQGNKLVDARFSPNGRYLAAAVNSSEGVGELWSYAIEGRRYVSRISRKSRMFTSQSSEKLRAELEEAKRLLADRPITRIAWSATGERLAVSWGPVPGAQGTDSGVVSLMLTECDGRDQHLRVVWRGLISGPPAVQLSSGGEVGGVDAPRTHRAPAVSSECGKPGHVVFRPTFRRDERHGLDQGSAAGALLTVCWENGRIANYPLYFPSLEGEHNKAPFMNR